MDRKTFDKFAQLIYAKAGIVLGDNKEALVQARLGKRMRQLGIASFAEYYTFVERDPDGTEIVQLLDVISTNVTSFFREARHFEVLRELLQDWQAAGQSNFSIWCAASSTGEEPYTLAMTVQEALGGHGICRLLATDISTRVLDRARTGIYPAKDVEKLPAPIRSRHFTKIRAVDPSKPRAGEDAMFQVVQPLRDMITFARLNLATPPFPMRGPFDVIFCRNVMIYFDNIVRRRLLEECHRLLRPGGFLMVGHAESLSGMLSSFKTVEPAVYIKA